MTTLATMKSWRKFRQTTMNSNRAAALTHFYKVNCAVARFHAVKNNFSSCLPEAFTAQFAMYSPYLRGPRCG
jgi:hypothetical protein